MLLSIYYFFKGIKPMDPDLNLNTTLGWARANCEPEDKELKRLVRTLCFLS